MTVNGVFYSLLGRTNKGTASHVRDDKWLSDRRGMADVGAGSEHSVFPK